MFKKSTKADAESNDEVAESTEDHHNGKHEKGKSANTPSANAKSLKKNTKATDTRNVSEEQENQKGNQVGSQNECTFFSFML